MFVRSLWMYLDPFGVYPVEHHWNMTMLSSSLWIVCVVCTLKNMFFLCVPNEPWIINDYHHHLVFPPISVWHGVTIIIFLLDLPPTQVASHHQWNMFRLGNPNQSFHLPLGRPPLWRLFLIRHGIQRLNRLRKCRSLLHQVTSMSP